MKIFDVEDNINEFEESTISDESQRLVDGIDLKDLMNGKDVIFKINHEYGDSNECYNNSDQEENEFSEISSYDTLRGKRGAPDPNSTFQSLSALMVNVDDKGYVKKEIITSGSGLNPPDHSRVTIHYNFYKENDDEPFDSTYMRGKPCKFCLNQGETIPGLEMAVKSMKKHENSRFLIKWEVAFGQQGCPPRIGKACDILADITLVDYTEIVSNMDNIGNITEEKMKLYNFEQTIKEVKNVHCSGNEEFNSGNVRGAMRNYRKCIKMLNEVRISNQEQEEQVLGLKVKCLVNLAICFNKQGRSEQACVACRDALSIDPNNVKAAFHYGKATLHLANFEIAEEWLKQAWKLKPGDEDVSQELDKLEKKKKEAHLEYSTFCQRAFGMKNLQSTKSKKHVGSGNKAK